MRDHLFYLNTDSTKTLQAQVREMLVAAILDGHIPAGDQVPSPRKLSQELGVARNTVIAAYNQLVEEGYLQAKERHGYFVPDDMISDEGLPTLEFSTEKESHIDWDERLVFSLADQRNIVKTRDWHNFDYPFITGQLDPEIFPAVEWRECCRHTLNNASIQDWMGDHFDTDNPELVEQLRTRVLPRRGVLAGSDEILITMGAQHALFLLSGLLMANSTVGIEDPGYPDVRNILRLKAKELRGIQVDEEGIVVDESLRDCDYIYVTPSHQSPTTVTMSLERRKALLAAAEEMDFIIIEDDYEGEINYTGTAQPSLYSLDRKGRVLYVSSLSKILAPGLRVGYLVAPEELIQEARALRRLMLRHTPGNNECALALFLSRGHYDMLIRRLTRKYQQRWTIMKAALEQYISPIAAINFVDGGTAFWLQCDEKVDCYHVQRIAAQQGILIEPGDIYFKDKPRPRHYIRLGFTSMKAKNIEAGIRQLGEIIKQSST